MTDLIEVNCPFPRKTSWIEAPKPCGRVVLRVYPGSSGVAWCRICKLDFNFEVDAQSNYKSKVIVKQTDE